MKTALRPMSLGEILDAAIRLYRRNFWLFVSVIALVEIPFLLVQVVLPLVYPPTGPDDIFSARWFLVNGANLLVRWIFVDGFGAALLTYAIAQRYLDQETSLVDVYRRLGAAWLGVATILVFFPPVLLALFVWLNIPCIGWLTAGGVFIFVAMGIMPFAPTAIMVEGQSGLGAVLRAWDLGRRRFFWIIAFNIVLTLFGWALAAGPSLVVNSLLVALIANGFGMTEQQLTNIYSLISNVSGTLFNMLFLPIQVGAWTLTYYDLRVRSEAFDLALLVTEDTQAANRLVHLPPLEKWLSGNDMAALMLVSLVVFVLFIVTNALPFFLLLAAVAAEL